MFLRIQLLCLALLIFLLSPGSRLMALESSDCADCHCESEITQDGGRYLYIDPVRYQASAHFEAGCTACHQDVSEEHPDDGIRPSRAACNDCHDEIVAEYASCAHVDNADCTDCHNPHQARAIDAVAGPEMNQACEKCHEAAQIATSHGSWLPQAELHTKALPCIACHTCTDAYDIIFYLEKMGPDRDANNAIQLAQYQELCRIFASEKLEALVDQDGNQEISLSELVQFNRLCKKHQLRLWGMLTPKQAGHCYQILDNRWDCSFCHTSGNEAQQTSYVALPDGQGRYQRLTVESGAVLEALYGTPDFYMVGVSRHPGLRNLGLLILAAGLMFPLVHGSLRLLTIKNRRKE